MDERLWKFIDDKGTFTSDAANTINTLYFPLCNASPIMSSISPDLHGDIKTDFNSFLLQPVCRIDLSNLKSSRNFWIYINPVPARKGKVNPNKIWSASGVSKNIRQLKEDRFNLEAGLLWHKISRQNKKIGLKAQITSFIPASNEPAEIMLIEITNISAKTIKFTPTCAIPIFARPGNNLFDHRHVTSLLHRIKKDRFGVVVTPALLFDETGHKKNSTSYFVFGADEKYGAPQYIYPTQEEFTGEASDLEAPQAVFSNYLPLKDYNFQGKEAMAGLKFKSNQLKPKQTATYIIIMGIAKDKSVIKAAFEKFNKKAKVERSYKETMDYWQKKSAEIKIDTKNKDFDNWLKWVNIQPTLRRIFGCSFLPDFDYGKGGRGWRDLWQDCLSLILNNPKEIRSLLVNNFSGVRIDGSNATIIGQKPGEFIADRNNINRVWMDHGAWPLITTQLYIHQTGDLNMLLDETTYFRDHQLCRSKERDPNWSPDYGKELKTENGQIYKGSLLEHLLIETLVQFFNVGPHNHILLEDADWNDGMDMASESGESVAFSAMYAQNLRALSELIERLKGENTVILKELAMLVDSITQEKIDYSNVGAKRRLLDKYFQATKYAVSGQKISIPKAQLTGDLKKKADWMYGHIRNTEWLNEGFFNGYYNNDKQRVEGKINGQIRMALTSQVFVITSGVATDEQVKILFGNVRRFLKDKRLGGFRLNTDFKNEQPNLGRAFSFVWGDKENGAFFNHMTVMLAYALYKRGFAREGYEVINSIYKMALDTPRSKIYPGLPEYFNAEGRGMYSYLTGSASWFIFTFLNQVFGIRGEYGNLVIEPKLVASQFKGTDTVSITAHFAGKLIEVRFLNPNRKDFGIYSICKVSVNGKNIAQDIKSPRFVIWRRHLLSLTKADNNLNIIEVTLD